MTPFVREGGLNLDGVTAITVRKKKSGVEPFLGRQYLSDHEVHPLGVVHFAKLSREEPLRTEEKYKYLEQTDFRLNLQQTSFSSQGLIFKVKLPGLEKKIPCLDIFSLAR